MKNTILLFLLVLPFYFLQAKKFVKADIEYTNGTTKTGYVGFPINANASKISFKFSESGRVQKIDSDKLKAIIFGTKNNIERLVYSKTSYFTKKKGEKDLNINNWLLVAKECKDVQMSIKGENYSLNSKKELTMLIAGAYYPTFLKKISIKKSSAVMIDSGLSSGKQMFRKNALEVMSTRYFDGNQKIIEKIEGGEFKTIEEILDYYCSL